MCHRDESPISNIFRELAARDRTSEFEVQRQIEIAIQTGIQNPDPAIRAQWEKVPCTGEIPTPEELILYIVQQITEGNDTPELQQYLM